MRIEKTVEFSQYRVPDNDHPEIEKDACYSPKLQTLSTLNLKPEAPKP